MQILRSWEEFVKHIKSYSAHKDIVFDEASFEQEKLQQYKSNIADYDDGQIADYRIRLKDGGSEIHLKEYDERYEVHCDVWDMASNPANHLIGDAPYHTPMIFGILGALTLGFTTRRR